ncbi:histidinol dehydrogenase [Thermaurantimonas aggregans]|nr:histidinol dehydrogenase [Thermaurantimonas aggregans]MCX8149264.1 histidinol dehydrogenase [Thermaurantimonas aggregans]
MMKIYRNPEFSQWSELLHRPAADTRALESAVLPILEAVKLRGDAALREYTARFDGVALTDFSVSESEFQAAEESCPKDLKKAIRLAQKNIETFHRSQIEKHEEVETLPGVRCWRRSVPIERVGLYVPGGSAPLYSTLLMLGVPARIAGCSEIVVCTPPQPDGTVHPAILFTAKTLGLSKVFKVGGAQAIAAMAYGTESIPAVYKIFGPGNAYVTAAKQLVARDGVAIDLPAGPSEVAVICDATAQPAFVAADLLSQAEHGTDSQVLLITWDENTLKAVMREVERQLTDLPRRDIAQKALENSKAILVNTPDEALQLSNAYAPEHLIIACADARALAQRVTNAGSVFIGHYSCESAGDYASGTNHTLPTGGYARAYSGVSLDSFVKKITFQHLSPDGLRRLGPVIETMAEAENLSAHRRAVSIRLNYLKTNTIDR